MTAITYKKMGWITFIWLGNKRIGEISRCYRGARKAACPTCGHHERYQVVTAFSLRIYGRLWRDGKLVPNGKGGCNGFVAKRLKDCKARAEELFA